MGAVGASAACGVRSCELSQPSRALYMTFLSDATMDSWMECETRTLGALTGTATYINRMFSVMNEWPGHALTQRSRIHSFWGCVVPDGGGDG